MSFSVALAIPAAAAFIGMIFFVIFGQVTVRKLRKNPKTKDELGAEFASGWDITNVAGALSTPKFIVERMKKSRLYFLCANHDLLYKHTNKFDRVLARIFFWLWTISASAMIVLMLLNITGIYV